jgi:hypothetical protein
MGYCTKPTIAEPQSGSWLVPRSGLGSTKRPGRLERHSLSVPHSLRVRSRGFLLPAVCAPLSKLRAEEIPQDGEDNAPDHAERDGGRYEGQGELEVVPYAGHVRVHSKPGITKTCFG